MLHKRQLVTIKGTRDGLALFIDDTCSFDEALREIQEVILISQPQEGEPIVSVTVQLGYRYLHEKQKEQLEELIGEKNRLRIQSFESEVIPKKEAMKWKEESEIKVFNRIVRSGQVLQVTGDLLLIGDVNPGGKIAATGNVYVLGKLRGVAHAGFEGDKKAFIASSYMDPSQLRIADFISRAPDHETVGVYMECGLVDEEKNKIVIDRMQVLAHLRKDLSGFERRMQNG